MPEPTIRIYDTLERKKSELVPLRPGHVGIYVCGPTVYDYLHIGNARPLVAYDIVVRHLRARGYQVNFVSNITDVDDKIIQRAAELGEPPEQLAARFTDEYHADALALGCLEPDREPRVTEHMPQIKSLIERLVARGMAYVAGGDVYFDVHRFGGYGELSHQPLDALKAGARVEVDERKHDPLDFALWKAAKPGEPSWPSPWGPGRPGWHIECSAMAEQYLGATFDLHGGGIDLAFPHHENERAQSQGVNGPGTFARRWLHNGFVNFSGGKISKSDTSLRVLFERAFKLRVAILRHGGEAVRGFLLTTQYRNPIQLDVEIEGTDVATARLRFPGLEEAERRAEYGYLTLERLGDELGRGRPGGAGPVAPEAEGWLERLQAGLDDDFNTAEALAALGEGLTLANRILDGKLALPKDVRRRTLERLDRDFGIASRELGLLEADPSAWLLEHRERRCAARGVDAAQVEARLAERSEARRAKDFARADRIRDELHAGGVEIKDTPRGTTWRVTD